MYMNRVNLVKSGSKVSPHYLVALVHILYVNQGNQVTRVQHVGRGNQVTRVHFWPRHHQATRVHIPEKLDSKKR